MPNYSGSWTLQQQMQAQAASNWPFGGPFNYIEDVFSTYLYTGNGSTQTITNGIDLAGKGGLVWTKRRQSSNHALIDTIRGGSSFLATNLTNAAYTGSTYINPFNSNGYNISEADGDINASGGTYASWTFEKMPKFFDIVTYTGNGAASRNISHALGSKPGFIILKRTDSTGNWFVAAWTGTTYYCGTDASPFALNSTNGYNLQNGAAATTTTFDPNEVTISSNYGVTPSNANINGATYVAYLFAHNAGGFGTSDTENVISCGSFTTNGSGIIPNVNLGYEPQWIIAKPSSGTGNWFINDSMRGWFNQAAGESNSLFPNLANAEAVGYNSMIPTATGFTGPTSVNFGAGVTYIYMAIRRPMKPPTSGTQVFSPIQAIGSTGTKLTTNFPVDLQLWALTGDGGSSKRVIDRLRGVSTNTTTSGNSLFSDLTAAEDPANQSTRFFDNTGYTIPGNFLGAGYNAIYWNFRRAPGFFDEVCWTGNASANQTVNHNLTVAPELIITKSRANVTGWLTYAATQGVSKYALLNNSNAFGTITNFWPAAPTATTFNIDMTQYGAAQSSTMVAYLFASIAGISKVGSYTGTGATQTINAGLPTGARFVLIKRTDDTGDWWVWDTARGMVTSTDPRLALSTAAAELNNNWVLTTTNGFQIVTTDATVNASGGSYIFLAIA